MVELSSLWGIIIKTSSLSNDKINVVQGCKRTALQEHVTN